MSSPISVFGAIKAVCLTIIVSFTLYVIYASGQSLERKLYPVVGPLEILQMEKVTADTTRIWVQFDKLRECRPIEVYWYHGRRDGVFERVQFSVEKPLGSAHYVNRPLGMQKSGPWLIRIPIEDMRDNAFSDAQHDCVPVWTSVSRFYN